MDFDKRISDYAERIYHKKDDSDPLYQTFLINKETLRQFIDSELYFPAFDNDVQSSLREISLNVISFLRTTKQFSASLTIRLQDEESLRDIFTSFGFAPQSYLSVQALRRLYSNLIYIYKTKGTVGNIETAVRTITNNPNFSIKEFSLVNLDEGLIAIDDEESTMGASGTYISTDTIMADPLWRVDLTDPTGIPVPNKLPHFEVSGSLGYSDILINALNLYHLSLLQMDAFIYNNEALDKNIYELTLNGYYSLSELWYFYGQLFNVLFKTVYTKGFLPVDASSWDMCHPFYTQDTTSTSIVYYNTQSTQNSACNLDLASSSCTSEMVTTLRTQYDLLFPDLYVIIAQFMQSNYARLGEVESFELTNFIKYSWTGYSPSLESLIVALCDTITPSLNYLWDLRDVQYAAALLDSIINQDTSPTYNALYGTSDFVVYKANDVPWTNQVNWFYQNTESEGYLNIIHSSLNTPVQSYLDHIRDYLQSADNPAFTEHDIHLQILKTLNIKLYNLIVAMDESLQATTGDDLIKHINQTLWILSQILETITSTNTSASILNGLLLSTSSEKILKAVINFLKPSYTRLLNISISDLKFNSPETSTFIFKDDYYDDIEMYQCTDSSFFVNSYVWNQNLTLQKPVRTELFNLDQYWTYTDQIDLDNRSYILYFRPSGKSFKVRAVNSSDCDCYFDSTNYQDVGWELPNTYAPLGHLNIQTEDATTATFVSTYRMEPRTYAFKPITLTQDTIVSMLSNVQRVLDPNTNLTYKILTNRASGRGSIPQDIWDRLNSYQPWLITMVYEWMKGNRTYYARYADDLVFIESTYHGTTDKIEYVQTIIQN